MKPQSNKPEPQGIPYKTEDEVPVDPIVAPAVEPPEKAGIPSITLPGDTVLRCQLDELAARLTKLEAWARGYAGPLLYRGLEMGEKIEVNKKTPFDPPAGRDIPDLKLREL